ncbi:winged helix-turn-helix domain-containing protein [Streptomyces sp. C11-1]|uniref:Winged helix-turn-helix domain-containing protein n=1 Tax=Streptomyces durocortorensis TaxID=2811104 RepID=A0ABY9VZS5_9ACTN|nr:winged helix-turn-helix domain-containing protein [Streptomyces durocortorensis]WNF29390.1 winged helix-turn-helix domain-containing protein [Streptomyces durocortorensis]
MGWWQIGTDTLATSRFVVSPLVETVASLRTLERAVAAHPRERAWLERWLPAYRRFRSEDPLAARIVRAAFAPRWNADFLTPAPVPPPAGQPPDTFAQELERVRATPPEKARADLAATLRGPLPAPLDRDDLAPRSADVLEWVWTQAVLPEWPARRRVLESDVIARAAQLSRGGWAQAIDGMRPGMRWLGKSRLQINAYDNPPRELDGAQLVFTPVTADVGWVCWDIPHRYGVVYPCAGALADTGRTPVPQALGALIGPARAGVLVLLASPLSTTQLTALTGQGLGSVGRHLRVLLDAGLVRRRRAGRSVLYFRTSAGDGLVRAGG